MKPDPERIRGLFVAALGKIDPQGWDAYLQAECAGDPDLAREVRLLLDAHLEAGSLLQHPALVEIVVTDTVPVPQGLRTALPQMRVVSVAGLLANAIQHLHSGLSLSALFKRDGAPPI